MSFKCFDLCHLGDGVEGQSVQESPKKSSSIVIPEDFESQKEMVSRVTNIIVYKGFVELCFLSVVLHFNSQVNTVIFKITALFLLKKQNK